MFPSWKGKKNDDFHFSSITNLAEHQIWHPAPQEAVTAVEGRPMQVTLCSNHRCSTGQESRPHRVQQAVLSCLAKTTEAQIFLLGRQRGLEEKKDFGFR